MSKIIRRVICRIIFALIFSALTGIVILKSSLYFNSFLDIFAFLYLLIGWIYYLKSDGFNFSKSCITFLNNEEAGTEMEESDNSIENSRDYIFSYAAGGVILIIISLLLKTV